MKSLLAKQRALNISRKLPPLSQKAASISGCDTAHMVPDDSNNHEYQMKGGEYKCIVETETFLVTGKSFTIEGVNLETGESLGDPVEKAYGATEGLYKVTANEDTTATFYQLDVGNEVEEEGFITYTPLLLRSFQGTFSTLYTLDSQTETQVYVYNPNGYKVTVSSKDYFTFGGDQLTGESSFEGSDRIMITMSPNLDGMEEGDIDPQKGYCVAVDVNVQMDSFPENWPTKSFYLKAGAIYSDSTIEDASSKTVCDSGSDDEDDGNGLGAGAIAGIVIACVVVVGAIAFCVVWFAVLKKGCGGKSKVGS